MFERQKLQLQAVIFDFIKGLHRSVRYDNICKSVSRQYSLLKIFGKILLWNFILHISLPLILNLVDIDEYYSSVILSVAYWPLNLWSAFLHVIYFIELVAHIDKTKVVVEKTSNVFGLSASITMAIYYMSFGLISPLTNLLINPIFSYLIWLFNFGVIALYHAFYCYNNLWQYQNIDLPKRIEQQSILWPYSLGYGCIASMLYLASDGYYIQAAYNLHMVTILIMPFVTTKPKTQSKLVLNMNIFSHVTMLTVYATSAIKMLAFAIKTDDETIYKNDQLTNLAISKTNLQQSLTENQIQEFVDNPALD
jgi:hypothetical protein